ncbi:MAG: hypothetical protein IKC09_05865 [Oscillospiraceae bacterium]|nr:hypothetical protein [Oscillospiraceae bacterium]
MKFLKNWPTIVSVIAIVLVLHIVLLPAFLFFGYPLSYALVAISTTSHVAITQPELDVQIDRIVYDFKHGGYSVYFVSPTSQDTYFRMVCDGFGLIHLDYSDSAQSKGHTVARVEQDYRNRLDEALAEAEFDFEVRQCFAEITHQYGNEWGSINKDFGITDAEVQALELDREYDFREFAAKYGRINIQIRDEQVTVERAAEILLELKAYLEKQNIPWYGMDFSLTYDHSEYVILYDFLYEDVYEEGLVDRVQESYDATQKHFGE